MDENHQHITPPTREEADQMWGNILSDIRKREQAKKKRRKVYSIAASIAILFIIGGIFGYANYARPDIYTSTSGATKIILADHTEVTLLKGAQLTVKKTFPADTRDVFLKGDALFKVSKSKEHPFIVHGDGYETKVLGTVFKVSQIGRTFQVDLFEGKVLVYKTGHPKDHVSLKPQQSFTNYGFLQASAVTKTKSVKSGTTTDKTASLTFTECTLQDAILVIERTYGIKVKYDHKLGSTKITINLADATANKFLQTLALQLNLNTKKNNDSTFELEK